MRPRARRGSRFTDVSASSYRDAGTRIPAGEAAAYGPVGPLAAGWMWTGARTSAG